MDTKIFLKFIQEKFNIWLGLIILVRLLLVGCEDKVRRQEDRGHQLQLALQDIFKGIVARDGNLFGRTVNLNKFFPQYRMDFKLCLLHYSFAEIQSFRWLLGKYQLIVKNLFRQRPQREILTLKQLEKAACDHDNTRSESRPWNLQRKWYWIFFSIGLRIVRPKLKVKDCKSHIELYVLLPLGL